MERSQQVAFPRPKRKGDATGAGVGQGQKACRNAGLTPDVCQGQDRRGTPCFMLSSPPSVLGAAEDSADDSPSSGRRFAEAACQRPRLLAVPLDQACAHRRRLAEFCRAEPRTGHRRRAPLDQPQATLKARIMLLKL